ncbi:MAG: cyclophilin-like fold protein [Dehalococcoidia bacterium]|nr:cyclophilin-like fold protein [Dehalococcoidia bacterium]
MGRKIRIRAGAIEVEAELNDTRTAQAIWETLPIKGRVNLWGDEIYFSIPLSLKLEAGQEMVNIGELGYWPDGNAFCIFFGPTPVSQADEIRPASPVAVFGKVIGDATVFKKVATGTKITVRKENNG